MRKGLELSEVHSKIEERLKWWIWFLRKWMS